MVENLADSIVSALSGKVPSDVIIFLISMFPVVELRGGMIAAKLLDVDFWRAFFVCYAGNLLPIPFILVFINRIFDFLRHKRFFSGIINKIEEKSTLKSEKALRWKGFGLLLFVAVPLPGTGGWMGALIAAMFDINKKISLPVIAVGLLIADFIMSAVSYGIIGSIL